MKFCEKCGAQLEDNVTFCTGCGAKVESKEEAPKSEVKEQSPFAPATKPVGGLDKKKLTIIVAVAAVALIAVIILLVNIFTGYKKPIKKYINALKTSANAYQGVYVPGSYASAVKKIKYEIKDTEDIKSRKLSDLEEYFEERRDEEFKFSKGKIVEVDYSVELKDGEDFEIETTFIVVKCGSKWYIAAEFEERDINEVEDLLDNMDALDYYMPGTTY